MGPFNDFDHISRDMIRIARASAILTVDGHMRLFPSARSSAAAAVSDSCNTHGPNRTRPSYSRACRRIVAVASAISGPMLD